MLADTSGGCREYLDAEQKEYAGTYPGLEELEKQNYAGVIGHGTGTHSLGEAPAGGIPEDEAGLYDEMSDEEQDYRQSQEPHTDELEVPPPPFLDSEEEDVDDDDDDDEPAYSNDL
jgi:hypothetical protein